MCQMSSGPYGPIFITANKLLKGCVNTCEVYCMGMVLLQNFEIESLNKKLERIRVPTAPGKPGKMVTVFPAWKNPGILRTFDSYIAWECISKNLPASLHSA